MSRHPDRPSSGGGLPRPLEAEDPADAAARELASFLASSDLPAWAPSQAPPPPSPPAPRSVSGGFRFGGVMPEAVGVDPMAEEAAVAPLASLAQMVPTAPMTSVAPAAQVHSSASRPAPAVPSRSATAAAPAAVHAAAPAANLIDRFLRLMQDRGASDLHVSVGRPPFFRIAGAMEPVRYRVLTDPDYVRLIQPIVPPHLWEAFTRTGDVDFAYEVQDLARFRVNLFQQERGFGAVFRIIPTKLMTIDQLGLPPSIRKITSFKSGLVLVTGPTGSGKSTTLSAIIHEINLTRSAHIVTIEDPIEFVHQNSSSLVSQREVGSHTSAFAPALRAAVREDPDLILVGEMRDLETIEMAVSAAGTGLMVFGTLHTNSAAKALDRIINVFPADRQDGVRAALAAGVKAVVAQQLLPRKDGGRVAAFEVMFSSPALSATIRDGKSHQIAGLIQTGKSAGMIAMDEALKKLVEEDRVSSLAALEKALDKDQFRRWLRDRGEEVPADVGEG